MARHYAGDALALALPELATCRAQEPDEVSDSKKRARCHISAAQESPTAWATQLSEISESKKGKICSACRFCIYPTIGWEKLRSWGSMSLGSGTQAEASLVLAISRVQFRSSCGPLSGSSSFE